MGQDAEEGRMRNQDDPFRPTALVLAPGRQVSSVTMV